MKTKKKTAANGRFGASGGVARPTVCADFQPFAPVQALVETPACCQAAASLAAIPTFTERQITTKANVLKQRSENLE